MKMTDNSNHDDPLADFFAAAQATAPQMRLEMRARIVASAQRQPKPQARRTWRMWLGQWAAPSLVGFATAVTAGVWIGAVMPMPVAAFDAPDWVLGAFSYFDLITTPFLGVDDPLWMGF